ARSRGVVVPQTAVVVDADSAVVQVVANGKVESRSVKLGLSTGSVVEIAEGLAEGEAVVSLAGTFVRDGDTVTAISTPPTEVPVRRAEAAR
ncbi:MAG: efflux RND transporter periplasmic adaptor subunit, partial [Rhizobiaceae bacterium]|nr:efflux RND transporter periplasmic adaptor subunit [Rhizobiaceae bacterium]